MIRIDVERVIGVDDKVGLCFRREKGSKGIEGRRNQLEGKKQQDQRILREINEDEGKGLVWCF